MSIFNNFLIVHIVMGFVAVLIGMAPIVTRKGSRAHRLSGRAFAIVMTVLLVCAWVMTAMRMNTYQTALSATASLTLFSGLRVLGRKRPDLRPTDRATALDWSATLAVCGVGLLILGLVMTGRSVGPAPISASLAVSALGMSAWDMWRFLRPLDWPFSPDLWRYEHLWKMLGAYSAVLSAFSGNFLTFLPMPWSALWPTAATQIVTIGWITVLARRRRYGLSAV